MGLRSKIAAFIGASFSHGRSALGDPFGKAILLGFGCWKGFRSVRAFHRCRQPFVPPWWAVIDESGRCRFNGSRGIGCALMGVENPAGLIQDFTSALRGLGLTCTVRHEHQPAPHKGKALPTSESAVYVFTLSPGYGRSTAAGANRTLKVGKAGVNCSARFQSQHYSANAAPSTLAATMLKTKILWSYIGITSLDESNVRSWIEHNTERDNFYLNASDAHLLGKLETYLKGRLGPVFEGGTE